MSNNNSVFAERKARKIHTSVTAKKIGRVLLASTAALTLAAFAANATELLVKKGQAFTTKNGTSVSPDSAIARNGSGVAGAVFTIRPPSGASSASTFMEGDTSTIGGTNVKLVKVTLGAVTTWFTLDTTNSTPITGSDSTFTLDKGNTKDTLGASITATDFARVPNANGSYDAILTVNTVQGITIVQIGPGETKRVAVGATPGSAVDIKAIRTSSTASTGSVELQVKGVSTLDTATNTAPLVAYGYSITVTGIGQRVDSSGTTPFISATVRTPNGVIVTKELDVNKPSSIVDTATNTGIRITARTATQTGNSVSAGLVVEQIQNASVFALGQAEGFDSIGTIKLVDAHDSVAVFVINGDTVQATVGKKIRFLGSSGGDVKLTVTELAIGKNTAFATVNLEPSAPTAVRQSKGLFTVHQDKIVPLSQNRYGVAFATGGAHTVSVYNIRGQMVASLPMNGRRGTVDLSMLPAGNYVMSTSGMSALGQCMRH